MIMIYSPEKSLSGFNATGTFKRCSPFNDVHRRNTPRAILLLSDLHFSDSVEFKFLVCKIMGSTVKIISFAIKYCIYFRDIITKI